VRRLTSSRIYRGCMSKTKNSSHVQIPNEPTRKQLSRAERDAQQRRRIIYAVGAVLAVVGLVVLFGVVRESLIKPNEPVANVNGELISTTEFQNRVRLVRAQLIQQADFSQQLGDTQSVEQVQSQLADPINLGSLVLDGMVDELLLKQAAKDFNVAVTPDEVEVSLEKEFGFDRNPPTPAPTRLPQPTPTASALVTQTATPAPTPAPTATPISKESAQKFYQDYLKAYSLSDQDYRKYTELRLLSDKVREAIGATVLTTTEQIQFQYMRIDSVAVPTVTAALEQDSFAAVYQAALSGTLPYSVSVLASEVTDWLPRDAFANSTDLGTAIGDAFFSTPVSQTTAIISNTTGTASFVGLITAKSIEPLSGSFLQQAQQNAIETWLQQRRNPSFLLTWADRVPTKP
jgi:hypothetical protein